MCPPCLPLGSELMSLAFRNGHTLPPGKRTTKEETSWIVNLARRYPCLTAKHQTGLYTTLQKRKLHVGEGIELRAAPGTQGSSWNFKQMSPSSIGEAGGHH